MTATVTVTFHRQASGRSVRGRCVRPTGRNRRHRLCARWVAVSGRIRLAGRAGTNAFVFTARIGRHRLGPGSYQLTAAPTAARQPGRARRVVFKIVG